MLGVVVLCGRSKPWLLPSLSAHYHHHHGFGSGLSASSAAAHSHATRHFPSSASADAAPVVHYRGGGGGAWRRMPMGEGSWNVAWDARPARWLLRPESTWLLFCRAPAVLSAGSGPVTVPESVGSVGGGGGGGGEEKIGSGGGGGGDCDVVKSSDGVSHYKIIGVLADGRCLFRAIAHGACLISGEEAPDESRQRQLADELRAQVVEELLRRRKEIEWFIDEDFEAYVKRIQQSYVWGGEPELLMASHVLKTTISVFRKDRTTGNLANVAKYGEEYQKEKADGINVLFHGYGHYDLLELTKLSYQKVEV